MRVVQDSKIAECISDEVFCSLLAELMFHVKHKAVYQKECFT